MAGLQFAGVAVLGAALLSSCSHREESHPALEQTYWVEEIATGLDLPRSIAWLPGGDMLVAEWTGKIRVLRGGKTIALIEGVPKVYPGPFDGLRDIKLDPDFGENHRIYLSYTDSSTEEGTNKFGRVFRARLDGHRLVEGKVIFTTHIPSMDLLLGPMLFLPDKTLLVCVGTGGQFGFASVQKLDNHAGKIIRIDRNGAAPPDNPFLKTRGALPEIWALGLRNPSGLALMANGSLWGVDIGPKGGDELDELKAGGNYGWPLITWGFDYSGQAMSTYTGSARQEGGKVFADPALVWSPSHTPSGLVQYRGRTYPFWDGDLFTGGLSGQSLRRIRLRNGKVVLQERMLADLNERFRSVQLGPDNMLYLLTDTYRFGRVLRLRPGAPDEGMRVAKTLFNASAQGRADRKTALDIVRETRGKDWSYAYDPVKGERHFAQFCSGCHSLGKFKTGRIGPDLNGIDGRRSGQLPGYDYSASFADPERQLVWNYLTLPKFLDQPQLWFPGTKMSIAPLPYEARLDIVNFLTGGELSRVYGAKETDKSEKPGVHIR